MRDGDLRKHFKKNIPEFDWQPIETGAMGSGIPDTNFCYESVEGWIEFKWSDRGRIELRPEQIGWIISRTRHGGLVKIAVRWSLHEYEYLGIFDGSMCEDFGSKGVQENLHYLIASWTGPPPSWNWSEVKEAILWRK